MSTAVLSPTLVPATDTAPARAALARQFAAVRAESLARAAPLSAEDQCVQSMPDASPIKWHLAHTSWFFETVLLQAHQPGYTPFDARYGYLFNSYYEALGPRHPRPQRGLLTRPPLDHIHRYRAHVDAALLAFMAGCSDAVWRAAQPLLVLGLQHEQKHQELMPTDVLPLRGSTPRRPASGPAPPPRHPATPLAWLPQAGGLATVGHGGEGFAFDNESPAHAVWLAPHAIADRPVSCGEYAAFVADGGYRRPELWLSDGWAQVLAQGWQAPAYWLSPDDPRLPGAMAAPADGWVVFGLHGPQPLDPAAPVAQLSFYEACAYAEWAGARLPTEFEWEAAAANPGLRQASGAVWQWTRSAYHPYPGFQPHAGAVGEYNDKFMVGQLVLRGGSEATPAGHSRPSYRNFFPPAARWQFSGLRLARDI